MLPAVLYNCETCSAILGEEHIEGMWEQGA
jgi:hypothetical protein